MTAPSRIPAFTATTCPTAKAAADAGITAAYVDGNLRVPTGYTNLPYPNGWDDPAAEETLASLTVTGDVAIGNDLAVNTDKATIDGATGNTVIAGTLGVAGNVAVNTDKFTVAEASGNTVVAGTLGVTGALTQTGAATFGGAVKLSDGGTVTQITTIATGVTINKNTGQIVTVSTTLAAGASASFIVTNSAVVDAKAVVVACIGTTSSAGTPTAHVSHVGVGAFTITLRNDHASAALDNTVTINFAVLGGA
jgi:hypothetical protein